MLNLIRLSHALAGSTMRNEIRLSPAPVLNAQKAPLASWIAPVVCITVSPFM